MQAKRILIRATNWVGDAVMSLPALQLLRAHHPTSRITVLARPWVSALYAREGFCDEIIPFDAKAGLRGIARKFSLADGLRARDFDCAVLLQNAFEAAAIVWWARIPVRIGYRRDLRGQLLTHPIAVPKEVELPAHQRFYYLELLKRAGLIAGYDLDAPIRLEGAAEAAASGRKHLSSLTCAENVIAVAPGAAYGGAKRWLAERFAEAAIQIARTEHVGILIVGSQSERDICEIVRLHIVAASLEATNAAGETDLNQLIELIAASRALLTNDSGTMHIASALGVPTVAVFGPTDEAATGPTGPLARVIREPVECSPCLLRECPIDHRCMTRVAASKVAAAAIEVMHAR
jgi:heptosyltransferase-2